MLLRVRACAVAMRSRRVFEMILILAIAPHRKAQRSIEKIKDLPVYAQDL